jgi:hypothetical protein
MSIYDHYFMLASCSAQVGYTIYFWRDTWNLGVLQWKFPQLFSYALNKNISLKAFREGDIQSHFWTPLSIEALDQQDQLQQLLELIQVNPTEANHWTCIWNSGEYISHMTFSSSLLRPTPVACTYYFYLT